MNRIKYNFDINIFAYQIWILREFKALEIQKLIDSNEPHIFFWHQKNIEWLT